MTFSRFPSALAFLMLDSIMNDGMMSPRSKTGMKFEELEAEYQLIQQKKSSLSYSRRCEVEYQYERMLTVRSKRHV